MLMRTSSLLLIALPGWVWGYLVPAPLARPPRSGDVANNSEKDGFGDCKVPFSGSNNGGELVTRSHAQRCRPLFRYGVRACHKKTEWPGVRQRVGIGSVLKI